jgi:hypothetical protein
MKPDDIGAAPPDRETVELLEELVARARARGIRTGIRNDEIPDLEQEEARDLIEQLQRRLGEAGG